MVGDEDTIEYTALPPAKGLDLAHLAHLQDLGLLCAHIPRSSYELLSSLMAVVDVTGLRALRRLHIGDGMALVPVIQQLSSLQQLQELVVELPGADCMGAVEVLRACLAGVAAATQLTQLQLEGQGAQGVPKHLNSVQLHGYLSQLTQLQRLDITGLDLEPSDAVRFTALTCLTALVMYNIWCSDQTPSPTSTAGALACRLPNLCVLELVDCGIDGTGLWLFGSATGLESLCVISDPCVNLDATAMGLLTGLTRLTSLTGPVVHASVEEYRSFRAAMPALVEAPEEPTD
jgi:hypothetical protein